jgi:hypothetical protein
MKRIMLTLGLATMLAAVTPAVAQAVDIRVASVEVTQAIQTPTNSIPLVAQRGTAVRATIGVTGAVTPLSGITGKLHVYVDGVEVTPAAGVSAINQPFTAPLMPLRNNENDTLNFELPAPTGIYESTNVDFRVDLDPFAGDSNPANNSGSADDLDVVKRSVPNLYYTSVDYTPSGLGLPDTAKIQRGVGDVFVRGILPVVDSAYTLYRESPSPTMTYDGDYDGDGILEQDPLDPANNDVSPLLNELEAARQLMVTNGVGADDRLFLYGWLAGNPIGGNGWARVGGRVAFGNTEDVRYQRSYAHELTHNFGLNHNTRTLDQTGWDVGGRLLNNPAGNNEANRVKPSGSDFDIQRGGALTNEAWIDTVNYTYLLNHDTLQPQPCSPITLYCTQYRVASVRGILRGAELVTVNHVFRHPWPSQPAGADAKGDFVAEATDTAGVKTTRRFSARIADDDHRELNGAFSVQVPVDPKQEIASLRILNASGKQFALLKQSKPPTISILSPRQGSALGDKTEVAWSVSDPDTPASGLVLEAAYSQDGGSTWVPIDVDISGTARSLTFDSSRVAKSEGKGMIRVFVSDGLNTAYATVDRLTR